MMVLSRSDTLKIELIRYFFKFEHTFDDAEISIKIIQSCLLHPISL